MKFTLAWLKDHLETDATVGEIADRLTALGLEIESVEDPSAALAPFTVAYVKEAAAHPNADKLRVCTVETVDGEVQVVCGAPNARTGMKGIFAPAGSLIPGTGILLKPGRIRDVASNGMLVSEREMGLSDEHDGIIDVAAIEGAGDPPIGTPLADLLGLADPVIDIALTPDRADCAGIGGIARDLAAAGLGRLKPVETAPVAGAYPSPVAVRLEAGDGETVPCPLFVGRHFRGLKNGPSPRWLQDRLRAVGLRPISALVDITNFFCLDRARPLHVFDAGKLAGDLVVRLSRGGEELAALNDKSYVLAPGMTVICDDNGPQALGGVIGGEPTGVTEDTADVFLEVALFDGRRTHRTGQALAIDSDARYRFERGLDPEAVIAGAEQATAMILDLCGGEASELVIAGTVPEWRRTIGYRTDRVRSLGGVAVDAERQRSILNALGFTGDTDGDRWTMAPPSWRADVYGEADLVEEVLRVVGYDAVPSTPLPRDTTVARPALDAGQRRAERVRRGLAARGLDEAVTWSFMDRSKAAVFGFQRQDLALLNPIASDLDAMRPTPLANLIAAVGRNTARGYGDVALFEVGPAYVDPGERGQKLVAAGVRSGQAMSRHWSAGERPVDAFDAKADALAALEAAGAPLANLQTTTDAPDWFHPGQSGVLRLGPNVLAYFGALHPRALEVMEAPGPLVGFEVFLDAVPRPKRKPGAARPTLALSPFQPLTRDFAFLVAESVSADAVLRAARGADKALIADAAVFDVYRGTGVPEGQKSIALAVTLQPTRATLTEAGIEAVAGKVVAGVTKHTGGVLRG